MSHSTSRAFNRTAIPNTITLLNLFFGCVAVVLAIQGHLAISALLIVLCSLLDFLDGMAARLLRAGSEMGKQLDSLADLISFGFASSAILYTYLADSLTGQNHTNGFTPLIPHLAFLIAVFSAIRLAKFNMDTKQSDTFIGLPTPANALFFASFPLVLTFADKQGIVYSALGYITSNTICIISFVVVFSYLLVSPVKMFSLKFKSLSWKNNKARFIFLGCSLCLVILLGFESPPTIMIVYMLISLFLHSFSGNKQARTI